MTFFWFNCLSSFSLNLNPVKTKKSSRDSSVLGTFYEFLGYKLGQIFSLGLNSVKNSKKSGRVSSVLGTFYEFLLNYKFEK